MTRTLSALLILSLTACSGGDKLHDTGTDRTLTDDSGATTDDTGVTGVSDSDGDGYDSLDAGGDDCDDSDAAINPGATELPYNGLDDDCDEATPDDDLDADGYPLAQDCDDQDPDQNPGAAEVPYNSVDDDCDAATPDDDLDADGYALAHDCDDTSASVYPGAAEITDDGIDQDCDGEDLTGSWTVDDLSAGDLVITEVMLWPGEVEWEYGQWVEITNVSGHEVDLVGLPLVGYQRFEIATSLVVPDGGVIVIGASTDKSRNGGAPVDAAWGSSRILGEGEEVRLQLGESGGVIDQLNLSYSSDWEWSRSISLEPTLTDATDNDDGASWCAGSSLFGWAYQYGTPGDINDSCPIDGDGDGYDELDDCDDADASVYPGAPETWYDGVDADCAGDSDYDQDGDGFESDSYGGLDCDDTSARVRPGALDVPDDGVDGDCDGEDATGDTLLDIDDLSEGDLVISEIMVYPTSGEENAWIELYNPLDEDVYLDGLTVYSEWYSYTIWDTLVVDAGGYVVLGNNADITSNGGVPVDHELSEYFWFGELWGDFGVSTDSVTVDNIPFDDRFYELEFWDGASIAVDPDALDADSNDTVDGWCLSDTLYGDGDDKGTPGSENSCPSDGDGDGYSTAEDCDDDDASVFPGAPDIWYDGVDADCAGDSDYDQDGDGFDSEDYGGLDCDDTELRTRPDAMDIPDDGVDNDCDGEDATGFTLLSIDDLGEGDLVISEIMAWGGVAPEAWWFEVHNPLSDDVYLDGLALTSAGYTDVVFAALVVEAGDYVVFGSVADMDENGGVPVDYQFSGLWLSEGDGREGGVAVSSDAVDIDSVPYDYTFPWEPGVSATLSPSLLNASDNDDSGSWCYATSSFGDGDLGTPGDANDGC